MKVIKKISSTATVVLFCFFTFTVANAAIVWDDFAFSYGVIENSADIYNMNIDRFSPVSSLEGNLPALSTANGDTNPNAGVADSLNPSDSSGLGLQLNAGAGGQHLFNGVRIEGYAATSTTTGGVLSPYAVGSPGTQEVSIWSNRIFHVDGNEAAMLSGMAGGVVNNPGFSGGQFLFADYLSGGGIWLDEVVTVQGIPLASNLEFFDFDDLLDNGPMESQVNLRTQDGNGDDIYYILRTALDLDSQLLNYDFIEEFRAGDIPVGALGSLGTSGDPLWVEGTMEAVPIPGSVILLLSGIAAVVGLRKRRS